MFVYGTINEKGKIVNKKDKSISSLLKQIKISPSSLNKIIKHYVIEHEYYNTLIKAEISKNYYLYVFVDRDKREILISDKEDESVISLQTAYETYNISFDDLTEFLKEDKKRLYLIVSAVAFLFIAFGMIVLLGGEEEEPVKPISIGNNSPQSANANVQPALTVEDYEKMRVSATNQLMQKVLDLINGEFKEHKGIARVIKVSVDQQGKGEGEIMFYYEVPTVGSELDTSEMLYKRVEKIAVVGEKNINYSPIFSYRQCVKDLLANGFIVYKISDRTMNLRLDEDDRFNLNTFIRNYNNCMFIINTLEISDNGVPTVEVEVPYALQKDG